MYIVVGVFLTDDRMENDWPISKPKLKGSWFIPDLVKACVVALKEFLWLNAADGYECKTKVRLLG